MHKNWMSEAMIWVASALAAGAYPTGLRAQLVRDGNAASTQTTSSSQTAKPAPAPPSGKRRLSQEIQLTGDQLWTETGVTLQPGEHVVATATGTMHYADAADDASPSGL